MHRFIQLLTSAVAVAAADPVVTSLLLPYNDAQPFVGTVLNVDASATTFAYTCASTVNADDCGMATHGTIVQGPSTWRMTLSQSDDDGLYALTAACALTPSKNVASCTVSETESDTDTQGSSTQTGTTTSYLSDLQAVTLVAGLDKLTGGATPSPSTASSTPTSGAGGSTGSQPPSTGSASQSLTSGAAASSSGAASPSAPASGSKTGTPNAAPAVTQQAVLVGVAAVVGALAL
ncbi:Ribosomal protein P2 [Cordyceps fumosorosea ARSEF 2679]|uniref:Ribosomal protein P2 n=1 Tax=Cordyceps fumosorosea (strain ARSEF 2679) TaxID=1081104 RepID=A0A167U9K6_CORFA|nr:Ribosomal protein P2 [Cordyceps fumosorosea ARSEF 2679]OAA61357.1 Ribosomal protein P2 [Cordyceps fumosorosea ARSEF 2679]